MFGITKICKAITDLYASAASYLQLIKYFQNNNGKKMCVCVSHAMSRSGAPQVLLEASRTLKKYGYSVCIISVRHGVLEKEIRDIDVFSCRFLEKVFMKTILRFRPDVCIINTIILSEWVEFFDVNNIPTLWWIHEGKTYIEKYYEKYLKLKINNTEVYNVSEWSLEAFKSFVPDYEGKVLYYGISDKYKNEIVSKCGANVITKKQSVQFVMTVIGTISERKNQAFVVQAFKKLPESMKSNMLLVFVGALNKQEQKYFDVFKSMIDSDDNIAYIPYVKHDDIKRVYEESDLVICASIDDPLPVVISEAMMYRTPFLTSRSTGQYYMVCDGINGFVFDESTVENLTNKILQIYQLRQLLDVVGDRGFDLYQSYFSNQAFEKNLCAALNHVIEKRKNYGDKN